MPIRVKLFLEFQEPQQTTS